MISNRLLAIVNLIKNDNNIADIGSDHGYVLIELRKQGFKSNLLGVENKVNPYNRLIKNIKLSNFSDIDANLSDGLDMVSAQYHTIILAGMGFNNIVTIISKNIAKLKNITNFIIDAHTDKGKVRDYFSSLGYKIEDETIVFEDNIYYDLINFVKCQNSPNYTKEELEFGPINLIKKEDSFINMIKFEIERNKMLISKLNSEKCKSKIKNLESRNLYLEGIISK